MRGRIKKLYIIAIILFVIINIGAIWVVFKKYRKDTDNSQLVSKTKFKFSKIKTKLYELENKLPKTDSIIMEKLERIELDKSYLDSMLSFDNISNESLQGITHKMFELSLKSNELEKTVENYSMQDTKLITN